MAKRLRWNRRYAWIAIALAVVVLITLQLATPERVEVTTATAAVTPLEVTVDEDGRTRAVDRYVITAPVAGELQRLPFRAGEIVKRGDVVARIQPLPLDERARLQLRAALDAAVARERSTSPALQEAEAAAAQAQREYERRKSLTEIGAIAEEQREQFALMARMRAEELASARAAARAAQADVRAARAALLGEDDGGATIVVRSPASGAVAEIPERSRRVVNAGEVIVAVTDPEALEVVVDVLSADAARIHPGMRAAITAWGGAELGATVRRVEPAAFTKLSALGVEEQRVNVILDLDQQPPTLGDGYRVEASIRVWHSDSTLTVPSAAVFRAGEGWRLFRVVDGRARLTDVVVGERSGARTEILEGISAGDQVVLFPSEELADGVRVKGAPDGE